MRIANDLTDRAILQALGARTERRRIEAGFTQAELAREAGVSKRTVERIEGGNGCELVSLIRVLRVLKLAEGFNALVPDLPPSPMALLKTKGKERQRVAHPRRRAANQSASASETNTGSPARRKPWTWGE